jgi:hypothetical protein
MSHRNKDGTLGGAHETRLQSQGAKRVGGTAIRAKENRSGHRKIVREGADREHLSRRQKNRAESGPDGFGNGNYDAPVPKVEIQAKFCLLSGLRGEPEIDIPLGESYRFGAPVKDGVIGIRECSLSGT